MYIARLRLENFMRYDEADIALHPGFNAIVGQTDAGKSTLLRALIWVLYNRPIGTDMCKQGSSETRVTLWTDTGVEVERFRSKTRNAYRLDDTWYDAVATGVPQPVQDALGVSLAQLGPKLTEMLNVSRQLDAPFLLSAPGADVAKVLGNLSGLSRIDTGLASLRPDLAKLRKTIDASQKLEENYQFSIAEFENLEQRLEACERIGRELSSAGAIQLEIDGLKAIQERMEEYNDILLTYDAQISTLRKRASLRSTLSALQRDAQTLTELQSLASDLCSLEQSEEQVHEECQEAYILLRSLQEQQSRVLQEAGTCPLCKQRIGRYASHSED